MKRKSGALAWPPGTTTTPLSVIWIEPGRSHRRASGVAAAVSVAGGAVGVAAGVSVAGGGVGVSVSVAGAVGVTVRAGHPLSAMLTAWMSSLTVTVPSQLQ